MGMLRHHASVSDDMQVGARCRGALAALEGRRRGGAAPLLAEDHLMISYALPVRNARARGAWFPEGRGAWFTEGHGSLRGMVSERPQ